MDIRAHNRTAWDEQVQQGNRWTLPVSPEEIHAARRGDWSLLLTPLIPVPREWYPKDLSKSDVLCLASGGGQQGPILAAAGARVTVLDNSPRQLAQDRLIAEREQLQIRLVEGDMIDLSIFPDDSFDLIFHPVSNCFSKEILQVWRECQRVLRKGGALLAGFVSPINYIFDLPLMDLGKLEVKYSLPYSDVGSLSEPELKEYLQTGVPLEYSHTFNEQIGGQLQAGLLLAGFYEDRNPEMELSKYAPTFFATRAIKP